MLTVDANYEEEFEDVFSPEVNFCNEPVYDLPLPVAASTKKKAPNISPSGPLGPAIEKVLKQYGSPMSAGQIVEALQKNNDYVFVSQEPIRSVFGQIRKMLKTPWLIKAADNKYALQGMKITPSKSKNKKARRLKGFFGDR